MSDETPSHEFDTEAFVEFCDRSLADVDKDQDNKRRYLLNTLLDALLDVDPAAVVASAVLRQSVKEVHAMLLAEHLLVAEHRRREYDHTTEILDNVSHALRLVFESEFDSDEASRLMDLVASELESIGGGDERRASDTSGETS